MGPNLFAHNENIAHVMPHGTAHAMTSCTHHEATQASRPPYVYMACQELLMDLLFMQAEQYCKPECAERILIAMLNENKADWNENFRIWAEEPIAPLYKWYTSLGL